MAYALFSPIGKSDPWNNGYDGAALHIIRHYKPKKIVLFFTEDLYEQNIYKEEEWKKILETVSPESDLEIFRKEIPSPHDFDAYKDIFHKKIESMKIEFLDLTILLNVTSGTPQMESTLCLERVTYPNQLECVQVDRPDPKDIMIDKNFEKLSFYEKLKIINQNEVRKRAKEIEIISFRHAMIKGQLRLLLNNFQYIAALNLLEDQRGFPNKKKINEELTTLKSSIQRHQPFDITRINFPDSKNLQKVVTHLNLLKIHQLQKDYAQILIRIKNLTEFICEMVINQEFPSLIRYERHEAKINKSANHQKFIDLYINELKRRDKYIENFDTFTLSLFAYDIIFYILKQDSDKYKKIYDIVNQLEKFTSKRNHFAHRIDEIEINKKESTNILKSVDQVFKLAKISFQELDEENIYVLDDINESIMEML